VGDFFSFRCALVNSPQLNTELSYECWHIQLSSAWRFTNALSFITLSEPKRDHYLQQFVCYWVYSLPRGRPYRTVAQQWSYSSQYFGLIHFGVLFNDSPTEHHGRLSSTESFKAKRHQHFTSSLSNRTNHGKRELA
jgi:hypothetical protein